MTHRPTDIGPSFGMCVQPHDLEDIERLFDRCFGPERQRKAAYRLRDGSTPIFPLSRVLRSDDDNQVIAAALVWPVQLVCRIDGKANDVLLFGPFGVDPDHQGQRLGLRLLRSVMDAIDSTGQGPVFLVGDNPIYKKVGFSGLAPRTIALPGGADSHRLKVRDVRGQLRLPSVGELLPPDPASRLSFFSAAE